MSAVPQDSRKDRPVADRRLSQVLAAGLHRSAPVAAPSTRSRLGGRVLGDAAPAQDADAPRNAPAFVVPAYAIHLQAGVSVGVKARVLNPSIMRNDYWDLVDDPNVSKSVRLRVDQGLDVHLFSRDNDFPYEVSGKLLARTTDEGFYNPVVRRFGDSFSRWRPAGEAAAWVFGWDGRHVASVKGFPVETHVHDKHALFKGKLAQRQFVMYYHGDTPATALDMINNNPQFVLGGRDGDFPLQPIVGVFSDNREADAFVNGTAVMWHFRSEHPAKTSWYTPLACGFGHLVSGDGEFEYYGGFWANRMTGPGFVTRMRSSDQSNNGMILGGGVFVQGKRLAGVHQTRVLPSLVPDDRTSGIPNKAALLLRWLTGRVPPPTGTLQPYKNVTMTLADPSTIESVMNIFASLDPTQIGRGRDGYRRSYAALKPVAIYNIDHSQSGRIQAYLAKRDAILQRGDCPVNMRVCTRTDKAFTPEFLQQAALVANANEHFLLHSASLEAVMSIIAGGFDITRANPDGFFASGIYFAENVEKADQYCKPPWEGNDPGKLWDTWNSWLGLGKQRLAYHDGATPLTGDNTSEYCCMLVVRVALGCSAKVTTHSFDRNRDVEGNNLFANVPPGGEPSYTARYEGLVLNDEFQSVHMRPIRLGEPTEWQRFREFVVYGELAALPTQLIVYERRRCPDPGAFHSNMVVTREGETDPYYCNDGAFAPDTS